MKKLSILLLLVVTIACNLKAQTKFRGIPSALDTSIVVDFDILINNSIKDTDNYYFEMIAPDLELKFKDKPETRNLTFFAWHNEKYVFIFTYKNYKPVILSVCTDTIKKRHIILPVRLNEPSISKRIQNRGT